MKKKPCSLKLTKMYLKIIGHRFSATAFTTTVVQHNLL